MGWALSTPALLKGLAVFHINATYCAPSPLQHGLAVALEEEDGKFEVRKCLVLPGKRGGVGWGLRGLRALLCVSLC